MYISGARMYMAVSEGYAPLEVAYKTLECRSIGKATLRVCAAN
jgi:hypothetical protein